MKTTTFAVRTGGSDRIYDITPRCAEFAAQAAEGGDGLLHVFVPHATAGLDLNVDNPDRQVRLSFLP
jgi:thiamine phosphate synthase YjbQ (UPF0047 family)